MAGEPGAQEMKAFFKGSGAGFGGIQAEAEFREVRFDAGDGGPGAGLFKKGQQVVGVTDQRPFGAFDGLIERGENDFARTGKGANPGGCPSESSECGGRPRIAPGSTVPALATGGIQRGRRIALFDLT